MNDHTPKYVRDECILDRMQSRRHINSDQHAIGIELRRQYEIAIIGNPGSIDPARVRVDTSMHGDFTPARALDAKQAMRNAHRILQDQLGALFHRVPIRVCCEGVSLTDMDRMLADKRGGRARWLTIQGLDALLDADWGG